MKKTTKYEWRYHYVPEGQLEPDEMNRWAIYCFILVNIKKALPEYEFVKELTGKAYMQVRVASIFQQGTENGWVPSTVHKYCATMPSFRSAGSIGLSLERNFFSNDIEELKQIVENEFDHIQKIFKHCR